jgi:hypothetical protein
MSTMTEQEIPHADQTCADRFPVGCGSKGHTGDERAHLLAEIHVIGDGGQGHRPCDAEEHQKLRGGGQSMQQGRQHVAHGQADGGDEHRRLHDDGEGGAPEGDPSLTRSERRQPEDDAQHHDVLDDEHAQGHPPVQSVDFSLVGEQLDDDDRAGKGERDRHVNRV